MNTLIVDFSSRAECVSFRTGHSKINHLCDWFLCGACMACANADLIAVSLGRSSSCAYHRALLA
jgi:hypothetical protein